MTSFENLAISAVTREYIELDMLFIQAEPPPPTYTSQQLAERVLSQYYLYDRRVILHDLMRQNNFEAIYGPANLGCRLSTHDTLASFIDCGVGWMTPAVQVILKQLVPKRVMAPRTID